MTFRKLPALASFLTLATCCGIAHTEELPTLEQAMSLLCADDQLQLSDPSAYKRLSSMYDGLRDDVKFRQQILPLILERLRGPCDSRAFQALHAMGPLEPAVIPQLLDILRTTNPDAQSDYFASRAASEALLAIGPAGGPFLVPALQEPTISGAIASILANQGPVGLEALIAATATESAELRRSIVKSLEGRLYQLTLARQSIRDGADAKYIAESYRIADIEGEYQFVLYHVVPALSRLLADPDDWVRAAAADALRRLGPDAKATVPALLETLARDGDGPPYYALKAMGDGLVPYLPKLIELLEDPKAMHPTLNLLASLKEKARPALPAIARGLDDHRADNRIGAAAVMLAIDPAAARQAIPVLHPLLTHEFERIQFSAARTLNEIAPEDSDARAVLLRFAQNPQWSDRYFAIQQLGAADESSENYQQLLLAGLTDADSSIRRLCAEILGNKPTLASTSVPRLIQTLQHDSSEYVRGEAATALGKLGPGPEDVIPALIQALDDRQAEVAGKANEALVRIGQPAILLLNAKREDPHVLAVLGKMQEPGLNILIEALNDADPKIRLNAVYEFGQMWEAKAPAAKALAKRLDDPDSEVRRMVPSAFSHIGPKAADAIPDILDFIQHHAKPNTDEAQSAVFALAQIGRPSIPALLTLCSLEDQQARLHAIWEIGEFGPEAADAASTLTELLNDSDSSVREHAQDALDKVLGKKKPVSRLPGDN